MRDQPLIKQEFVRTLDHIESTLKKVRAHSGRGAAFSFPDAHKIAEGLFLSAWTHWQEWGRSSSSGGPYRGDCGRGMGVVPEGPR